jgi:thiol:disulfide interchange protein
MFRPTLVIAYEGGPVAPHLQPAAGEDLEAARAAAAKRGVPLAVKFYSPWCPVSTKVNQTTFQDGAVTKLCAERVELVSLKVEDHPQLAQELGAVQVPMLVVRSADGSRTLATVEADVLRDAKACATRLAEIAPTQ